MPFNLDLKLIKKRKLTPDVYELVFEINSEKNKILNDLI